MFVLTPVSALRYSYPTCPAYSYERSTDSAVHRAAYDYALAHARAEAIRQRDQEQRYQEAVRREQVRRRAEVVELVEALYEQQSPQYVEHALAYPSFDAERYRERLEVEAARRRAELLRQRHEAERARAAFAARQRAEVQHRQEAQRREQEHWLALLNSYFGSTKPEASTSRPVASAPKPSSTPSKPSSVTSELHRRLETETDPEMLDTLQHLLYSLEPEPSAPVDRKGKARETPATPFSFPQSQTVHFNVPVVVPHNTSPSSATPSKSVPAAQTKSAPDAPKPTEGTNLHRTSSLSPTQAQAVEDHIKRAVSLSTIEHIQDSLQTLQSGFVFPTDLDLARPESPSGHDSDSESDLVFTSKNRTVHAYEHALNGLLEKLDAVESFGDEEIRGRRKAVVGLVEGALKEVGRRVEESRERERVRPSVEEEKVAVGAVDIELSSAAPSTVTSEGSASTQAGPITISAEVPAQESTSPSTALGSETEHELTGSAIEEPTTVLDPVFTTSQDAVVPAGALHSGAGEAAVAEIPVQDVLAEVLLEISSVDADGDAQKVINGNVALIDDTTLATIADAEDALSALGPDSSYTSDDIASPFPDQAGASFLLQPGLSSLPHAVSRSTQQQHEEDDVDVVSVGDVSEGESELKEWDDVESIGSL